MKVGTFKRFNLPNCSFLVEKVQGHFSRAIYYKVWFCNDSGTRDLYIGSFDSIKEFRKVCTFK
jgi:hypothetical protein